MIFRRRVDKVERVKSNSSTWGEVCKEKKRKGALPHQQTGKMGGEESSRRREKKRQVRLPSVFWGKKGKNVTEGGGDREKGR